MRAIKPHSPTSRRLPTRDQSGSQRCAQSMSAGAAPCAALRAKRVSTPPLSRTWEPGLLGTNDICVYIVALALCANHASISSVDSSTRYGQGETVELKGNLT